MFSFDITGPTHPDTTYYIRYRGAVYADCGNFRKCILLWLYALDTQQQCLEPLHPMIQSSFLSFTELFQYMQKQLATTTTSGGGLGQRDAGQREPLSLSELSKFSAAERNSMCSVQSMYTATVLKILQQAVEEIKRGLMLLQQIQEKLPSLTSHSPSSSSSSSSSSPSSPSSSKSPASQADELIAGMCFFFI